MVKEVGEVEEEIAVSELISEVRREMRNLSTRRFSPNSSLPVFYH